jgi:hypothetical protein
MKWARRLDQEPELAWGRDPLLPMPMGADATMTGPEAAPSTPTGAGPGAAATGQEPALAWALACQVGTAPGGKEMKGYVGRKSMDIKGKT